MKAYHVVGEAPMYTNTFLLISEGGHAAVIDPAAAPEDYNALLKKEGAALTDILCTHGHFDHVGSAAELKEQWHAKLWCEKADLGGGQFFPLQAADSGYEEGGVVREAFAPREDVAECESILARRYSHKVDSRGSEGGVVREVGLHSRDVENGDP